MPFYIAHDWLFGSSYFFPVERDVLSTRVANGWISPSTYGVYLINENPMQELCNLYVDFHEDDMTKCGSQGYNSMEVCEILWTVNLHWYHQIHMVLLLMSVQENLNRLTIY